MSVDIDRDAMPKDLLQRALDMADDLSNHAVAAMINHAIVHLNDAQAVQMLPATPYVHTAALADWPPPSFRTASTKSI
jgi:hypothetical protein